MIMESSFAVKLNLNNNLILDSAALAIKAYSSIKISVINIVL